MLIVGDDKLDDKLDETLKSDYKRKDLKSGYIEYRYSYVPVLIVILKFTGTGTVGTGTLNLDLNLVTKFSHSSKYVSTVLIQVFKQATPTKNKFDR